MIKRRLPRVFLGHIQKLSGQPAVAAWAGRLEQVTFRGPFQPQPSCDSVIISSYMRPLNGNVPVPNTAMYPELAQDRTGLGSDAGLKESLVWWVLWRWSSILLLLWTSESYPEHKHEWKGSCRNHLHLKVVCILQEQRVFWEQSVFQEQTLM